MRTGAYRGIQGKSLIGFRIRRRGREAFSAVNPATGQSLAPAFFSALPADVDRATAAAAFPFYSRQTGKQKRSISSQIRAWKLDGTAGSTRPIETALPEGRGPTKLPAPDGQMRFFADLVEEGSWVSARIDRGDPNRKPLPKPDIRSFCVPSDRWRVLREQFSVGLLCRRWRYGFGICRRQSGDRKRARGAPGHCGTRR